MPTGLDNDVEWALNFVYVEDSKTKTWVPRLKHIYIGGNQDSDRVDENVDDSMAERGSLTFRIKYDNRDNHSFMGSEANFFGTTGTANGIGLYYVLPTNLCQLA